ncbi:DUF1259 domain-containing protein [Sporosarcina jiandibaonis]|uniref:DUF1259 domain-containing protein n=1 Tax=Sporosarcina jiandibaonis TaxID=2715535 RepID=UPI00155271FF|nr:DUF1259 domain-containing protein [Sporosarcina jiandibaonis]
MVEFNSVCTQFAEILRGKSKVNNGVCSVDFHRRVDVTVQGKPCKSVASARVSFESLDQQGVAINLAEIAILEEESAKFMKAAIEQGLIVSALHNQWILTEPTIMHIHIQSVESPLNFAEKLVYAFGELSSKPVGEQGGGYN